MPNKIKKKIGITIADFTLGLVNEIETDETLKDAENFINNTGIVASIEKLKNMMFGRKIAENTLNVLGESEKMIKQVESTTGRHELSVKTSVNIIENAGLEDNVFLQNKRASMLANAITQKENIKNHYPEILKQLSEIEVKSMDYIFNVCLTSNLDIKKSGVKKNFFINDLNLSENEFDEVVDNLSRLNLIHTGESAEERDDSYISGHMKRTIICITTLGYNFVKACKFL